MLKIKRRPQESWLDWHRRSFGKVKELIRDFDVCILDKLENLKRSWAGHCVRFGLEDKEPHMLKALLFWRPFSWWKEQQWFNDVYPESRVVHAAQQGVPKRWDAQFSSNWAHVLSDIS